MRVQRTRSSPSALREPLTRRPLGVARTSGALERVCSTALLALVTLACGKTESVAVFKSQERISSSDNRAVGATPPRAVVRVEPVVPKGCLEAEGRGRFVFEATVSESGTVESIRRSEPAVVSPPCPELEEQVRKALSRTKYEPTMIDGRPSRIILTIAAQVDYR